MWRLCWRWKRGAQGYGGEAWGKEAIGRHRRRWENDIKMDVQELEEGCGDWMDLAKNRVSWRALVSTVMKFRVP